MADITNPSAIPVAKRDTIKSVLALIGPQLVTDSYPTEDDGNGEQVPKTVLDDAEAAGVFEDVTRVFWRDQIKAFEANEAAEVARKAALDANATDPWDV